MLLLKAICHGGGAFGPSLSSVFIFVSVVNDVYVVNVVNVELQVVNYRPIKIFINGEVESPGMHVLPGTYSLPSNPSLTTLKNNLNPQKNAYSIDSFKGFDDKDNSNQDEISAEDQFQLAFDNIRNKKWNEAKSSLSQFIIENPENQLPRHTLLYQLCFLSPRQ